METLFAIGVSAFGAASVLFLTGLLSESLGLARVARWTFALALTFWAVILGAWMMEHGPRGGIRLLSGASALSLGVLYLAVLRRSPIQSVGAFAAALSTLLALLASLGLPSAHEPGAILLSIHVCFAFAGVTAFAFGGAVSAVYWIKAGLLKAKRPSARRLPPLEILDRLALRSVVVGFPLFTLALMLGSAYALHEPGGIRRAYLLAGVAWVLYGGVLLARLVAGWRGRRAVTLTLAAFSAVLGVVLDYALRVP